MNYKTRQPFPHAAYVEGQRNFTYFDRSLTSGLTDVIIESPGDFLYIDQASTGVVSVELNMRQGGTLAPILLAAGGSIECDFASFKLTATAQLNKSVRIIVGNGARIKGGANVNAASMSVSVVDGGRQRTLEGNAFIGFVSCSPAAGQYGCVQLMNPGTNTKNAIVKSVSIGCSTTSGYVIRQYDTALAISYGAPPSKYIGGTASVMQLRTEAPVAIPGTAAYLDGNYLLANSPRLQVFSEPIVLTPGKGLLVSNNTVAKEIMATFELCQE